MQYYVRDIDSGHISGPMSKQEALDWEVDDCMIFPASIFGMSPEIQAPSIVRAGVEQRSDTKFWYYWVEFGYSQDEADCVTRLTSLAAINQDDAISHLEELLCAFGLKLGAITTGGLGGESFWEVKAVSEMEQGV